MLFLDVNKNVFVFTRVFVCYTYIFRTSIRMTQVRSGHAGGWMFHKVRTEAAAWSSSTGVLLLSARAVLTV